MQYVRWSTDFCKNDAKEYAIYFQCPRDNYLIITNPIWLVPTVNIELCSVHTHTRTLAESIQYNNNNAETEEKRRHEVRKKWREEKKTYRIKRNDPRLS